MLNNLPSFNLHENNWFHINILNTKNPQNGVGKLELRMIIIIFYICTGDSVSPGQEKTAGDMLQQKILQMPKCYQCSSINENNLKRLFRKFAWKFIEYPFNKEKSYFFKIILKEYSVILTVYFMT